MMIFTFMPTMAFAANIGYEPDASVTDTTVSWNDDFSEVTVNGTVLTATRTAMNFDESGWDGLIRARAIYENPETEEKTPFVAYFRDLNGASVTGVKKAYAHENFAYTVETAMEDTYDSYFITLAIPSYLSNLSAVNAAKAIYEESHLDEVYPVKWYEDWNNVSGSYECNYTKTVKGLPEWDETLPEEETVYNAAVIIGGRNTVTYGTSANPAVVGSPFTQKITKKAVSTEVGTAVFTLEGASYEVKTEAGYGISESPIYTIYNGAEQTLVMKAMTGYSVSYETYDYAKGKYVAAEKVVVKDVVPTAEQTLVRATVTKDGTTKKQIYLFDLIVVPAHVPTIGFDKDGEVGDYYYKVDGSEYNALDYIVVEPYAFNATSSYFKNANKAFKAAVKADEATWMELFNDTMEITSKAKKSLPNVFELTIEEKELTPAQETELEKKYKQLQMNYSGSSSLEGTTTAWIRVNAAQKDYEVEFTNAPSKVTFKGNKKGKLTKDKSFTVTAVANNGDTVFYKLVDADTPKISIDKNTGKVTVKKGLKKGTYKMKVKAYTLNGSYEYQAVTVKIKKK
jgi:hypothetical protein